MATVDASQAAPRTGDLRNYVIVTGAYWADTLTDGALRTLVLFYFFELGYTPFEVASLFIFYELFGVITNLAGGYIGARLGLKVTLFAGLCTQLVALAMLGLVSLPSLGGWAVPYVMAAQALSGIAKDLTKMSSKSAVKFVVPQGASTSLYRWVALLTGSKNAVKGIGFFVGGLLLTVAGFRAALVILAVLVASALTAAVLLMGGDLGTANKKANFRQMFSPNRAVNLLAAARLFLFGSRDVWFVVGLPVFLRTVLGWDFWQAGGFLAVWTIGYSIVQASAPRVVRRRVQGAGSEPDGKTAMGLAFVLAAFPAGIAVALIQGLDPTLVVVGGLFAFGVIFALNSAIHSFLILAYTDNDQVAMNVGFYYMANAGGRLAGTVLSGMLYQAYGLIGCLWAAVALVLAAGGISLALPTHQALHTQPVSLGRAVAEDGGRSE
jgi:hypothetical protein